MEENNKQEEAKNVFLQAWSEATNNFEKLIAAHFITRHQSNVNDKLKWIETSLTLAQKINNDYTKGIIPALYLNMAECYEELGNVNLAEKNYVRSNALKENLSYSGPFYHGTRADLKVGNLLTPGGTSNYKGDLKMNHIYFTAQVNGAGLAAELAKGEGGERIYIVEPTGSFEDDPNVTDKKFPGNPTRSFRSKEPLKIIGEVKDWEKLTPEELQKWREKLANNKGEIIN
jgi:hypothetical protein